MLEVGEVRGQTMTLAEQRAQFSFWCMLAAPLMAGNDLRHMTAEARGILLNREAISLDQDPLGKQGFQVRVEPDREIWAKPLSGGGVGGLHPQSRCGAGDPHGRLGKPDFPGGPGSRREGYLGREGSWNHGGSDRLGNRATRRPAGPPPPRAMTGGFPCPHEKTPLPPALRRRPGSRPKV